MRDRETGRSRGFGFVTLGTSQEAQDAIEGLHDQDVDGRRVKVNLANARPSSEYKISFFLQSTLFHADLVI
jgi:cold-inducible RNA-binding protein